MVESISTTINLKSESVENYFKFHVDAMNKSIILYNKNGHTLNYAIMDDKKNVRVLLSFWWFRPIRRIHL